MDARAIIIFMLKKHRYLQVELPVLMWREDKSVIMTTPALDLSTFGNTIEEAQEAFEEAVFLFFETLVERDAIDDVLSELGWTKIGADWTPGISALEGQKSIPMSVPVGHVVQ